MYICDGEKFIFGHETIAMPVQIGNIPETFKAAGEVLLKKDEFHISLVPLGHIAAASKIEDRESFFEEAIELFCAYIRDTDISLRRHREEFRIAEEAERKSLVVMGDVSGLKDYYDRLNERFKIRAEVPPTHVTLYTLQPNAGIFLTTQKDIEELTDPVSVPDWAPRL